MLKRLEQLIIAVWTRVPYGAIGAIGAVATLGYVLARSPDYARFWSMGALVRFPDGSTLRFPLTRLLVDLTFVLMGIAFLLRRPPRKRNDNAVEILVAGLGACMPMVPHLLDGVLSAVAPSWRQAWRPYFMDSHIAWWRTMGATLCLAVGNALDVWAYAVLSRSFSVVPEARAVVTRGPYRWVRHPVYAGQLLSQAGLWLFLAVPHGGWGLYYAVFFAIQLYRSKVEERVLLGGLGADYRDYAARVWWFWRMPT